MSYRIKSCILICKDGTEVKDLSMTDTIKSKRGFNKWFLGEINKIVKEPFVEVKLKYEKI